MRKFIQNLYSKFNGICQSCGVKTSFLDFEYIEPQNKMSVRRRLGPTYPTREHLIPKCILRGKRLEDNITLFCFSCNNGASVEVALVRKELDLNGTV